MADVGTAQEAAVQGEPGASGSNGHSAVDEPGAGAGVGALPTAKHPKLLANLELFRPWQKLTTKLWQPAKLYAWFRSPHTAAAQGESGSWSKGHALPDGAGAGDGSPGAGAGEGLTADSEMAEKQPELRASCVDTRAPQYDTT